MKTKDSRELEILNFTRTINNVSQTGVDNLGEWFGSLNSSDRKALHDGVSQGAYLAPKAGLFGNAAAKSAHANEEVLRKYRRALTAILIAKSVRSSPQMPMSSHVLRAKGAVPANITLFEAQSRIKAEMVNFDANRQLLSTTNIALEHWIGWETEKARPLVVGCNIGRRGANGPGTLGCFVTIGADIYILSNQHVLAQLGIDNALADDAVVQPAHQCGGTYFDVIAEEIIQEPTLDAAIAKVASGIECVPETREGRAITGSGVATMNSLVYKRGCASKARIGEVVDVAAPNVMKPPNITAVNQLLIRTHASDPSLRLRYPFQVQGDSGSVAVDAAGRVVALMHGQSPNDPSLGQATHIGPILAHFGCAILTTRRVAP